MSEHRDEHLDLCAAFALGNLEEADRLRLEAHLSEGCRECEAAIADFSAGTVLLAASAPPARPGPELRSRVLAAYREDRPTATREVEDRGRVIEMRPRRTTFVSWGWAAAAAALAIATGITWNTASRLRAELDANRRQLDQLEQRLAEEQRWGAVLNSPDAKVVELAPTPAGSKDLRARAIYDPATQRAVLVFENFKAPSGRDYELWAIRGTTPAPASLGLIHADETGRAMLRLENVGDPETLGAFAVSLEPQGGAPTPTAPSGPVVMVGKVSG